MQYLLQQSLLQNDFGLRKKFPWLSTNLNSKHIQTYIRRKERRYLNRLFEEVYEYDWLEIERIENPYLWGRYVLQYEEMKASSLSSHVEEHIMVHATSDDAAYKIAESNFNWRLVKRARFGTGVSFASDPEYADFRATDNSVFIVAGVLVANSSKGHWNQPIPNYGDDTTTGYTEEVCVKYRDNDFYPYYIVSV